MDRALVYTTETFEAVSSKLRCIRNVPFELVPRELIEQIRPYANPPSYEQWLAWCPYFNEMSNYWNIALVNDENEIMAFQYGTWDPCGAEMHIIRATIHPKMFRVSGAILQRGIEDAKKLARELGMRRVYWMTCRWRAFQRKLLGKVGIMEAKVMEVLDV